MKIHFSAYGPMPSATSPPPPGQQPSPAEQALQAEGLDPDGRPNPALAKYRAPPSGFLSDILTTYNQLGGQSFLHEWAEDNPSQFVGVMMKAHEVQIKAAIATADNNKNPQQMDIETLRHRVEQIVNNTHSNPNPNQELVAEAEYEDISE